MVDELEHLEQRGRPRLHVEHAPNMNSSAFTLDPDKEIAEGRLLAANVLEHLAQARTSGRVGYERGLNAFPKFGRVQREHGGARRARDGRGDGREQLEVVRVVEDRAVDVDRRCPGEGVQERSRIPVTDTRSATRASRPPIGG